MATRKKKLVTRDALVVQAHTTTDSISTKLWLKPDGSVDMTLLKEARLAAGRFAEMGLQLEKQLKRAEELPRLMEFAFSMPDPSVAESLVQELRELDENHPQLADFLHRLFVRQEVAIIYNFDSAMRSMDWPEAAAELHRLLEHNPAAERHSDLLKYLERSIAHAMAELPSPVYTDGLLRFSNMPTIKGYSQALTVFLVDKDGFRVSGNFKSGYRATPGKGPYALALIAYAEGCMPTVRANYTVAEEVFSTT